MMFCPALANAASLVHTVVGILPYNYIPFVTIIDLLEVVTKSLITMFESYLPP